MLITRLIYSICLKAFSLTIIGNGTSKSGNKSLMREPVNPEKSWRATTATIRFTKLIRYRGLTLGNKCNITGNDLFSIWVYFSIYMNSRINIERNPPRGIIISQRSKAVHGVIIGTMGNPKGRKFYGFGGLVVGVKIQRGPETRQFCSMNDINPLGSVIYESGTDILYDRVTKVIHDIANMRNLILAYEAIKSNPGNMTPGVDTLTLDGVSLKWLDQVKSDLLAGKFKFSSVRRVQIPKLGKKETRPLGVVSPRDKIVQTAMLQVLESIYEPVFKDCSHGFRPNKGCHTALRALKQQFSNVSWVIEGDISKCYDSINHDILIRILRKRIQCDKTIALIKKFLKTPFKENDQLVWPKIGTFQGSSLSPLLCNIYLHEMDLYVEDLKKSFDRGKRRRKLKEYRSIQYKLERKDLALSEIKSLRVMLRRLKSKDPFLDPSFRRLSYIRYADDFVIGIIGSRNECIKIREDLGNFLTQKLSLNLSLTKTSISHFNKKGIFFLGTQIKGNQETEKLVKTIERGKSRKFKARVTSRTRMFAPLKKLLQKSIDNNMFKRLKSEKIVPTALKRVVNYDHSDIIRFFNSKIRGILNYYSFVDNAKSLGVLIHGLKHSCALTLALKYKLRERSKVFKKYGKDLECKETGTKLFITKTFARTQKFKINPQNPDALLDIRWNNKLTHSNLNRECLICGETPCEMHHVKKIKDLVSRYKDKKIDYWTLQMAAINRKQIPLCKAHHIALHRGSLLPSEAEKLRKSIKEFKH